MNQSVQGQVNNFSKVNDILNWNRADQFEAYAIYCVLSGNYSLNIDHFDVRLDGDEFGIDGVAIVIDDELCRDSHEVRDRIDGRPSSAVSFHFFQMKTSSKFDHGDISKFYQAVKDYFSDTPLKTATL